MEIKIEYLKIDDLKPYEKNARKHEEKDIKNIAKSIEKYGFNDAIGIWSDKNIIVEGHGRLLAAKRLGMKEVPVVRLDHLSDEQRREYAIAHNATAELSEWDFDILEEEMEDLGLNDFDFEFSFEDDEKEIVEDDAPEVDDMSEPKAKIGDIYQLGRHRLMCGDSTSEEDVRKLMNGKKADMVFTDPPYALFGNSSGLGLATDDMIKPFFYQIMKNSSEFTKKLRHVYICCDWKSCNSILTQAKKTNLQEKNLIVWVKNGTGLGYAYQSQYELIWFFENYKGKNMSRSEGEFSERRKIKGKSNVWQFQRVNVKDREHNSQKPVELISYAIKNSSFEKETVLDLFGGSGSTLISCEQLDRTCYMMEIDPKYIDVIIKRLENFTGEKAVLLDRKG